MKLLDHFLLPSMSGRSRSSRVKKSSNKGLPTGVGAFLRPSVDTVLNGLMDVVPGNQGTEVNIETGVVRARNSSRGVAMNSIDDIDVEGYLNSGGDRYVSKKRGYLYFDLMFCAFVNYTWDKNMKIPMDLFSDKICAAHRVAICIKYDYSSSSFRKAMAALRGWRPFVDWASVGY